MCVFWLNTFHNDCQSPLPNSEPQQGGALLAVRLVVSQTDSRTEPRLRFLSMFGRIGIGCGEGLTV